MNLHDSLVVLRKRAALIVAAIIVCGGAALAASLATRPVYQASAKLLVVAQVPKAGPDSSYQLNSAYQGALLSQQLLKSFAEVITSRRTAELALRERPEGLTGEQLQRRITAEPILDTLIINLQVQDTDAERARRLTNSVASAFIRQVPSLQGGSALKVSQIEAAVRPNVPIKPTTTINVAGGLVVGLLLGVGAAIAAEHLDTSVRTPEVLEAMAGAPVLGTIPSFDATAEPLPVSQQPHAIQAESFRKLRTNFSFLSVDKKGICCAITSSSSSEGKSTVTANLGLALASAGQRVVIVDTDLRRPLVHKLFGLHQEVGTTSVLLDRAKVEDALQYPVPSLAVLTSGPIPPNPSELLGSQRMVELIEALRERADVVLLDCPPVLPVADPVVVSRFTDGVLLIAHGRTTSKAQIQATANACRKAGVRVLGTVLNAARLGEGSQPGYYEYYAADADKARADSKGGGNGGPNPGRSARRRAAASRPTAG